MILKKSLSSLGKQEPYRKDEEVEAEAVMWKKNYYRYVKSWRTHPINVLQKKKEIKQNNNSNKFFFQDFFCWRWNLNFFWKFWILGLKDGI